MYLGDVELGSPDAIDAPPIASPDGDLVPARFQLVSLWDYSPALDGLENDDLPLVPPAHADFFIRGWALDFGRNGELHGLGARLDPILHPGPAGAGAADAAAARRRVGRAIDSG